MYKLTFLILQTENPKNNKFLLRVCRRIEHGDSAPFVPGSYRLRASVLKDKG